MGTQTKKGEPIIAKKPVAIQLVHKLSGNGKSGSSKSGFLVFLPTFFWFFCKIACKIVQLVVRFLVLFFWFYTLDCCASLISVCAVSSGGQTLVPKNVKAPLFRQQQRKSWCLPGLHPVLQLWSSLPLLPPSLYLYWPRDVLVGWNYDQVH